MLNEGDIILLPLQQSDGVLKNRPVLLLRKFPPYNDFLVCGISTQLKQQVAGFDFIINSNESYFKQTGLLQTSLIRLGFLAMVPSNRIPGKIGAVNIELRNELLTRLSNYLLK